MNSHDNAHPQLPPLWVQLARMIAITLMVLTLIFAVQSALLAADHAARLERSRLQAQLPQLAKLIEIAWRENNYPLLVQLIDNASESRLFARAWLVSADGTVITASDDASTGLPFTGDKASHLRHAVADRGELIAEPIKIGPGEFLTNILWRGIPALLLCMVLLIAVTRRQIMPLTRTLESAVDAARAMAEGDFSRQLPPQTSREIEQLRQAMNHAAVRLQELTTHLNEQVLLTQQATASKTLFLASMSHELRTPLNAVLGYCSLLQDSELSAEQRKYLRRMHNAGELLLGLISDLLDFSHIESGRLELIPTVITPAQLLQDVFLVLEERAAAKLLDYRCELDPDLPEAITIDGGRLRQILINLLGNAIKFTDAGSVCLKASWAPSGPDHGVLCIDVEDTGIGMDEDAQQHIFEPFTQADASVRERFGGSGLGLSICRQIAQAMGGELSVRSAAGQGSIFSVRLPAPIASTAIPAAPTLRAPTKQNSSRVSEQRVLVAEDNPVNRTLLVTMLKKMGCEVDTAADGRQAVAKAQAAHYPLILLDWQMPELDGLQAAQQIRQNSLSRDAVIIAVTANAFADDRRLCIEAGMDDFLAKPFTYERLSALLLRYFPASGA